MKPPNTVSPVSIQKQEEGGEGCICVCMCVHCVHVCGLCGVYCKCACVVSWEMRILSGYILCGVILCIVSAVCGLRFCVYMYVCCVFVRAHTGSGVDGLLFWVSFLLGNIVIAQGSSPTPASPRPYLPLWSFTRSPAKPFNPWVMGWHDWLRPEVGVGGPLSENTVLSLSMKPWHSAAWKEEEEQWVAINGSSDCKKCVSPGGFSWSSESVLVVAFKEGYSSKQEKSH